MEEGLIRALEFPDHLPNGGVPLREGLEEITPSVLAFFVKVVLKVLLSSIHYNFVFRPTRSLPNFYYWLKCGRNDLIYKNH